MVMTANRFPTWLKQERIRRGLSQEELARKIGTTRVTINRWENGATTPTNVFWTRLSKLLGKPIEQLFPLPSPEEPLDNCNDSGALSEKMDSALVVDSDDQQIMQEQMLLYPNRISVSPLIWEQEQLQLKKHHLELLEKYMELQQKRLLYVRDKVQIVLEVLEPELDPAIQTIVFEAAFSYLENLPFDDEGSTVFLPFHWIKETVEAAKKEYARIHNPRKAANITIDELEKLLDRMEDNRFLGESDLADLYCVSTRLKQEASAPALIEKGIAVREVLNAALEQLRGAGLRHDAAPDWRSYNILYYRHFRYHMKNEQISARLQFTSIRQYYRERNKALEALLIALLELENAAMKPSVPPSTFSELETER